MKDKKPSRSKAEQIRDILERMTIHEIRGLGHELAQQAPEIARILLSELRRVDEEAEG